MSQGASATGGQAPRQPDSTPSGGLSRLKGQLRGNPLIVVMVAGAASIAILVALLMWASAPEYRVLYSNLGDADGGKIVNELETRGIPYRFSAGGQALMVPGDNVHSLRLQLAEQGLPQGGNVGLELMDDQAFGISQFAEQVNYQRGLEGELSRSMESLGPISRARVHLALAQQSVFVRDREPAKGSVILTLHPGRTLAEGQVRAIVHMVSSSVPELAADDVTVVDQDGRLLSAETAGSRDLDGTQLDYIAEVERSYQRRIESILVPLLGRDNVRAQVAAQVDFASREQTSERYGPNQPPNEAAVRSRQASVSYNGGDDLAQGIPGALSNTPPGVAPSPIELAEGEADEDGENPENTEASFEATNNLRRDEVTNFEVDRSVEHVLHRRGQVERLSAAVVVNFRDEVNAEGEPTRVPLSAEEIAQIERLVRQAMGFSTARGDEVEVVNSAFSRTEQADDSREWWQSPDILDMAASAGRYLLVALAALLIYLLILRPLIKRHTQAPMPQPQAGPTLRVQVGDDDEPQPASAAADDEPETFDAPRKRRRKSSAYEENLSDLRELAQEDPRMVAMIVRSWMNKE
ncbi:flagellar basal-body MS-ring/collar protein FliF [Halomonas urumqiensis]|uniref:Flagellar M-ring protein n=1 Tax=Halomonas urumqiensis TaxID=1684789 RepID=A0A2N7UNT9_9GAMM|nr:flagellar basal-body MS-ring/collar protein FliF [Halomonas urumqiensis]PMR82088.1 flagellar basal body M-ring protein FliF [Halomonas urumqiensis]PTB02921.1 flagellar basal body M-ring protein FliF [Halomonas urumqiensis]GHE21061.1 flagellar M-ring protein [Halomonas urumqiensis]